MFAKTVQVMPKTIRTKALLVDEMRLVNALHNVCYPRHGYVRNGPNAVHNDLSAEGALAHTTANFKTQIFRRDAVEVLWR